MNTANENKSMLRPRDQRQAFRKISQTKYAEHDKQREDGISTKTADISIERSISVDHAIHGSDSLLANLKDYIEQQFLQLRTEIQMLKEGKSNKEYKDACNQTNVNVKEREVLAECETFATVTTEPYALTGGIDGDGVYAIIDTVIKPKPHFGMDGDGVYENIGTVIKSTPHLKLTTSNPLYGGVQRESTDRIPNVDSVSVKRQRHHAGYDNVTLMVPKRIEELQQLRSTSVQMRAKNGEIVHRTKSDVPVIKAMYDERECLANALQFKIEELVDGLIFNESELPDCLLMEGCLTEDECSTVRKLRDRKDQIRILLSIIKGRDLRVLKGFMKHIEQHNPGVAEQVTETFERNKQEGLRGNLCARCKLEKQFNIKHIVDCLWAIQAIDDGLYYSIIYSDTPIGAQDALWKKIFSSLSCLDPRNAETAHSKLLKTISNKNMFTHLADGISNMLIKNHGKLTCSCEPRYFLPNTLSSTTSWESFSPYSSSDDTSNGLLSFKEKEYRGNLEMGSNGKAGSIVSGMNGGMENLMPHLTTTMGSWSRHGTQDDDTTIPKTTASNVIPLPCSMKATSASSVDIPQAGFTSLHQETASMGSSTALSTKPSLPKKVASKNIPTVPSKKPSVPKKPNWSGAARN